MAEANSRQRFRHLPALRRPKRTVCARAKPFPRRETGRGSVRPLIPSRYGLELSGGSIQERSCVHWNLRALESDGPGGHDSRVSLANTSPSAELPEEDQSEIEAYEDSVRAFVLPIRSAR